RFSRDWSSDVCSSDLDLALAVEAAEHLVGVHPALDELEGDLLLEGAVGALGEVDRAHPAAPQLAHDPVRPDGRAQRGVLRLVREIGRAAGRGGAMRAG